MVFPFSFQENPAMDRPNPDHPSLAQELEEILRRARDGDTGAAQQLFDKYAKSFLLVIRRNLGGRLRTILDSEDFLQEARMELFTKNLAESCESPEAFLKFMTKVAQNKVLQANRKYLDYQGKNLKREIPLDTMSEQEEPAVKESGVCELMIKHEQWERLLRGKSKLHRAIINLIRRGFTHREVADKLQINENYVRRWLAKLKVTHFGPPETKSNHNAS
jgi:RNA polymerase sigma factor (sigma-70 family)